MGYIWIEDDSESNNPSHDPEAIRIDPDSVTTVSFACPTIFDMQDFEGNNYYFRLRNGSFRFANDDTDDTLVSGLAPHGIDGVCSLDEAMDMITAHQETVNVMMD